jgi:hypothetical protein
MRSLYKHMTPACIAAVIMFVVSPAAAQDHADDWLYRISPPSMVLATTE